ncbi:MAG: hypothetical protein Tsb0026_05320 [Sulfuricaulis sp.]
MNHHIRAAGRFLQYGFFVSALILAAAPAHAASVSFFLDQSNELPDGVNYLSVSLTDNDTGGVNILVKTLDPFTGIAGDNFGIQKFGFSLSNGVFEEITDLSDGWKVKHNKSMSSLDRFDFQLQGKGWARTDELSFKVSGVSVDDFDPRHFTAHVAGFEWCNIIGDERRELCSGEKCLTSANFTDSAPATHMPIPPAAWLLGSGLIGLVAVARRKA